MKQIAALPDGAAVEDNVDHLLLLLARIPGIRRRVKSLIERGEISEVTSELRSCLSAMEKTADTMTESDDLQRILLALLEIGNFLNYVG